jgi:hypothetical protein
MLLAGSLLTDAQRQWVAQELHNYTGLPIEYLLKADLRVEGGNSRRACRSPEGLTTG